MEFETKNQQRIKQKSIEELCSHILNRIENHHKSNNNNNLKPFISLCWAQSLDGSISSVRGQPTALSGPESLVFTHSMRSIHDGILVGIKTVLSDNPRLTNRFFESETTGKLNVKKSPVPIVLDSHLSIPIHCRLVQERGRELIIVCNEMLQTTTTAESVNVAEKIKQLAEYGCKIVQVHSTRDWKQVMQVLMDNSIKSVMVEGGGEIILSLLSFGHMVDEVIVTICPRIIFGGYKFATISKSMDCEKTLSFAQSNSILSATFGSDLIMAFDRN